MGWGQRAENLMNDPVWDRLWRRLWLIKDVKRTQYEGHKGLLLVKPGQSEWMFTPLGAVLIIPFAFAFTLLISLAVVYPIVMLFRAL